MGYFAVIDTETNWDNKVMSIGIVIADDKTFEQADERYYIFDPEYRVGGLFSSVLKVKGLAEEIILTERKLAMQDIEELLEEYSVEKLFAYNAAFDKNLLRELSAFEWFDIMRIAAYRQYNCKIPANAECCKTGKMKRNYGVEPMMQMLSGNRRYMEVHNAVCDARDELEIMRLLEKAIEEYEVARL